MLPDILLKGITVGRKTKTFSGSVWQILYESNRKNGASSSFILHARSRSLSRDESFVLIAFLLLGIFAPIYALRFHILHSRAEKSTVKAKRSGLLQLCIISLCFSLLLLLITAVICFERVIQNLASLTCCSTKLYFKERLV